MKKLILIITILIPQLTISQVADYTKDFFILNDEKVMFYIIKRQYSFKPPQRWYVDIINQGYKDCNMDREYLKKRLTHYNIDL